MGSMDTEQVHTEVALTAVGTEKLLEIIRELQEERQQLLSDLELVGAERDALLKERDELKSQSRFGGRVTTSSPLGFSTNNRGTPTNTPLALDSTKDRGWRENRRRVISAQACVVCGRDDQQGEQRAKGFKCTTCVGLPSNPHFVRAVDDAQKLVKGRGEDGEFVVNNYTILEHLGEGAFGKVRLVEHNETGRKHAVKCLSKEALTRTHKRRRGDPMKPVRDEISIMKQLSHPNVIQIYGTMESEAEIMIVMEYLPGGQIYPSKYPAKPVPLPTLKRYLVGITRGLDYLHDNGIIHRDVKPENILLDSRGNVKLADFGVSSKVPDESDTLRVWGFIGTPPFMPPEAFSSVCMNGEAADVWAFGVTAYVMAFGNLPWPKVASLDELGECIRTHPIAFEHTCAPLNDLLGAMLSRDLESRIRTHEILRHPLLVDIRIRKGHPVTPYEVHLDWDPLKSAVTIHPSINDSGAEHVAAFFNRSSGPFMVIPDGDYEITFVDRARDPRRGASTGSQTAPRKLSQITTEDWDDEELEGQIRPR